MSQKKRVVVIVCICLACLLGIVIRIQIVNNEALSIPAVMYPVGDKVELNGSFVESAKEKTQGYALKINSARLISYNDYLTEHNVDQNNDINYDNVNRKSIVELEVTFYNAGNTDGFLDVMGYKLIPERGDEYFVIDSSLWHLVEKNAPTDVSAMTLVPDSEYTTCIPFIRNTSADLAYSSDIDDKVWNLCISNAPVKNEIAITILQ